MATDTPEWQCMSECLRIEQSAYRIIQARDPWVQFQIEHLLEYQIRMDRERLTHILKDPSGLAFAAVAKIAEYHEESAPVQRQWEKHCKYKKGKMEITNHVDGVLLAERYDGKKTSPVPHEYERIELREDADYKKKVFPPFLCIREIVVSALADRVKLFPYLLDHVKKQCKEETYDFLCADVDAGDERTIEELEAEEFMPIATTFPRDDARWMVWPEDWNKRWV